MNRAAGAIDPDVPDLATWLRQTSPAFNWDWPHLRHVIAALDDVTAGRCDKLMVLLPPRHGKSQLVTIRYPLWRMLREPGLPVIVAAYNQALANKFSRVARKLAGDALSDDRAAVEEWELANGSSLRAVGVGGGATGHGGKLIVIDDPVKGRKEADSPTYRQWAWDWYADDIYTRREPGGALVLIQTRWHRDDLAGRILRSSDGPNWRVVKLPAVAGENDPLGREPGAALCPERYPLSVLGRIRGTILDRGWYALYQQEPRAPGGAIFQSDWWQDRARYHVLDQALQSNVVARYISYDTAEGKSGDSGARTSILVGELTNDYRLLVRHVRIGRPAFPELAAQVPATAQHWNHDGRLRGVLIEDKSSGVQLLQTLSNAAPDWLRQLLIPIQPKVSKEIRGEQAAVWCRNGCVWLPEPCPEAGWLFDFETELFDFPTGEYMDQVDALTQLVNYLEHYLAQGWHSRGGQ